MALPIHFFCPSSTHSPPPRPRPRRAVVVSPPATPDPTSGSVRPNAPIFSIRAISGSQRCFCSSEPHRKMDPMARPPCTPKNVLIDGSTRASSIAIMPSSR